MRVALAHDDFVLYIRPESRRFLRRWLRLPRTRGAHIGRPLRSHFRCLRSGRCNTLTRHPARNCRRDSRISWALPSCTCLDPRGAHLHGPATDLRHYMPEPDAPARAHTLMLPGWRSARFLPRSHRHGIPCVRSGKQHRPVLRPPRSMRCNNGIRQSQRNRTVHWHISWLSA
jgi:hypothetical protein